jgi:hypothetical protein
MSSLGMIISATVQLSLMIALVAFSFHQIRMDTGHKGMVATAYLTTLPIVLVTLFICTGGFLEKALSPDQIENIGIVATATMLVVTLVSCIAALVCLTRKIKGWRVAFALQSVAAIYLALILSYVAMGKPFTSQ